MTTQPVTVATPVNAPNDASAKSLNSRLVHIDGLRGLAILLVMVTHAWAFAGAPGFGVKVWGHTVVLAAVPAVGYVGVNLFLVLSGFCLTWPFARDSSYRERMTVRRFWVRRFRRIAPAYYASFLLIVLFRVACAAGAHTTFAWPTWADVGLHTVFLHNFSPAYVSNVNGSYWSLALEFQLYLLFPLLFEAMRRWGGLRVLAVCLGAQLAYRIWLERTLSPEMMQAYEFVLPKGVPGRALDFVAGMATAFWIAADARKPTVPTLWIPIMAITMLATAFAATDALLIPQSLIDVLWSFGFAALVWWASLGGMCNRWFCFDPLVRLGLISYSVYLLHQPLVELGCYLIRLHFRPGSAFFLALALLPLIVGLCTVFYLWCEKPFLDWFATDARTKTLRPHAKE